MSVFVVVSARVCVSVCVHVCVFVPVCVDDRGLPLCAVLRTHCIFAQTEPQVTSMEKKKKIALAQLVVKLIWRPTKAGDVFLLFHTLHHRQSHSRFICNFIIFFYFLILHS